MDKQNAIIIKSENFAVKIVELFKYLSTEKKELVISKQILRSGTSIGANIAEAECGITQKDFLLKMYIAFKETAETNFWLKLLYRTNYINDALYSSLKQDCEELRKILSSITKTMSDKSK